MKHGWGVLKPVGDRLPYDLAFDVEGTLIKIQVKYAWFDESSSNYFVDKGSRIYPFLNFEFPEGVGDGSEIHLAEAEKRQRKPRSAKYRGVWEFILKASVCKENLMPPPVGFP